MSGRKFRPYLAALLAIGLTFSILGCQMDRRKAEKPPTFNPDRLAVLPFMKVDPEDGQAGATRSPLTGATFTANKGSHVPEGLAALDRALSNYLADNVDFTIIPMDQAGPVYSALERQEMGAGVRQLVMATGRKLNADAVMVGHLYRFRERVGTEFAAESPASAAFELAMVRTADGMVIWKNSFDETQQSLSENILNLDQYAQHGLRWYSAAEFATYGLQELMKRFPWSRGYQPAE